MTVIGLCGGSGAGKTTATETMRRLGAEIIDTDRVYRELCIAGSECLRELADAFGGDIIGLDGELDRKRLAALIYNNTEARTRLNETTHKYIKAETVSRIEKYRRLGAVAVVVDAPLLFESGFDSLCDTTVGVVAKRETRIGRIVARDGISREHASARIDAQYSEEFLRGRCEYILENNGGLDSLAESVAELYAEIVK